MITYYVIIYYVLTDRQTDRQALAISNNSIIYFKDNCDKKIFKVLYEKWSVEIQCENNLKFEIK